MRTTTTRIWTTAFAVSLFVLGCSSADASDDGAAPTISDLTLSPLEAEVGKPNAISGKVSIEDADGDVAQIAIEVTLPDGTQQALPKTAAQGAGGVKQGQLALTLAFAPPQAGAYQLSLFVVDGKGHESNRLGATVTAK